MPQRSHRLRTAFSCAALIVGLPACSGDGGDGSSDGGSTTYRAPTSAVSALFGGSERCEDESGDLYDNAKSNSSTTVLRGDPASVDVVDATFEADDAAVRVTFTSAADVIAEGDPSFVTFVGLPNTDTSFELLVETRDGAWIVQLGKPQDTTISTYEGVTYGFTDLSVPVTVEGPTVGFEVPRDQLPLIQSATPFLFGSGATASDGAQVTDECSGFSS